MFHSFGSFKQFRVALVLLAVLCAVGIGALMPSLTSAMPCQPALCAMSMEPVVVSVPPAQTPDPATTPDALASAIIVLVGLVITFISGGGVSVLLEMLPAWTKWQSPAKGYIVIALSILIVAGLTSAKVIATPTALAGLPDWVLSFVGSVVFSLTALFGTQITYKRFLA